MRSFYLSLVLALAGSITGLPAAAHAQWGPEVPGTWSDPAYRHFLLSPYSYRTYSASTPGYAGAGYTPYGYQSYYLDPGYQHQRITPRGYESYRLVPGYQTYEATPFGFRYSYTPGYGAYYFDPAYPPR
jgi:hypothetical protein